MEKKKKLEQERLEANKRVQEKAKLIYAPYKKIVEPAIDLIGAYEKLEDVIDYTARNIHSGKITMQEIPIRDVLQGLIYYYLDQLPFNYKQLKRAIEHGLEDQQTPDKVITEEDVDYWGKAWEDMRPQFQILLDVLEEFNYRALGGFLPEEGDEKRCALVEKSLRETFEDLFAKDIEKGIEHYKQEEIKEQERRNQQDLQEKEKQQKEAEERAARSQRIDARFGIGKGDK